MRWAPRTFRADLDWGTWHVSLAIAGVEYDDCVNYHACMRHVVAASIAVCVDVHIVLVVQLLLLLARDCVDVGGLLKHLVRYSIVLYGMYV